MENQESNLPITVDPETMGGTPVFRGSRVPVSTLFQYLERNYSLEDFLYEFPSVTKEVALSVLSHAERFTLEHANA
jgi:uncharacterized protein (DUF433 family)